MKVMQFCSVVALVLLSGWGPILQVEALPQARPNRVSGEVPKTAFADFQYDAGLSCLTVRFQDGRTYLYRDVPESVFTDLTRIVNRGEYFARHVRDRYACERLPEADGPQLVRR